MVVRELVKYLEGQPQELQVAYQIHSEQCLLNVEDIVIAELCEPRNDGWIQNWRPDMPKQKYLLFPGN